MFLLFSMLSRAQINVESFGAIADGHTDNSAAIQKAIDSLKPGQKLIFPCTYGNRYLVHSPLDFGRIQYASIEGNGPGCLLYYGGTQPSIYAFSFVGAEIVDISGMDFYGGDTPSPPKVVLLFGRKSSSTQSGQLKLSKVRVEGYATKALIYSIASEENSWLAPSIYLNGGGALYAFYTSTKDDLEVAGLPRGSNLSLWMQNYHISDYSSAIDPAHVLIYDAGADSAAGNHTFRDGYLSSVGGTAFALSSPAGHIAWMNLTIDSNRFENGYQMFNFKGGGSFGNITLTNNESAGVSGHLVYFPATCRHCTFVGNATQQGDKATSVYPSSTGESTAKRKDSF